ncbi:hypothetical protein AA0113_g3257 [Alternaria arborescens]|uniref:Uncharacterized protein n=1 Tax=Alternaria arborescens TaxID=156630 RepID=A0A4Q4SK04_9PLEO|nr:hypothetical protein AA0111_g2140 [Alternaria arborescens]RYO37471.1 hypothetical protein AA0111_g2140 [Alternaria arborescens]RYO70406.1 hypothetical protein AA0113_g3257 [Alternaria arborescens]
MLSSTSIQAALLACLAATTLAVPTSLANSGPTVADPLVKRDSWCISWYEDVGCTSPLGTQCGGENSEPQPCTTIGFNDETTVKSIDWQPVPGSFLALSEGDQCASSFPLQLFSDQDNGCQAILYDMKYFSVSKN